MNSVCCKCKSLVVNSTTCTKCKNVFHLSCLRSFKNYSLIADDVNSINSCPRCDKSSKIDLENTTITLLREQNEFLRAELDELKKSFKDSVKHILDEVEERVSMLFENLRDDLKSSITTSVRQEFDGFKPVVDTIFKTNLGSISTNQTPACTPSETDKPYLPKTQLFNRRKIILLADGKGRNCVKLLNEYLSHNEYDVSSIIKPNASFEKIVADNISTVHCQDFVMIFGGDVEVSSGKILNHDIFNDLASDKFKNTKIILIGYPFSPDRPVLNKFAYEINCQLHKIATSNTHNNIFFLDANKFIFRQFQSHISINDATKRTIIFSLVNYLSRGNVDALNTAPISPIKC